MFITEFSKSKPKLLLHICCIGCGAYVSTILRDNYDLALYFYNPNIYPESEYQRRLGETRKIADKFGLNIIDGDYNHETWLSRVRGRESDPERGRRCIICYGDRLENTAKLAKDRGYDYFTTTLSISPHKDASAISRIGNRLAVRLGVRFLDRDFKKKDGFKKSVILSRELGLYRQNYCGCEFGK